MPMTVSEVLALFGTSADVARITGAKPSNVRMWKVLGIPPRWHHKIVEAARERGLSQVTHDLLASLPRPELRPRDAEGEGASVKEIGATPLQNKLTDGMPVG